jgi:hypothetical protein
MPAIAGTLKPVEILEAERILTTAGTPELLETSVAEGTPNISCRRDVKSNRDGGHCSDSRNVNSSRNKISSRGASNIIDHDNSYCRTKGTQTAAIPPGRRRVNSNSRVSRNIMSNSTTSEYWMGAIKGPVLKVR